MERSRQTQKRELASSLEWPSSGGTFSSSPPAGDVGFLNRYMVLDQQFYLQDNLLYKVDRMSMAHSLEVRPPLLDHRIVEFAARLPEHLKMRGSQQKVVFEELDEGQTSRFAAASKEIRPGYSGARMVSGSSCSTCFAIPLKPDVVRATSLFDPDATEA